VPRSTRSSIGSHVSVRLSGVRDLDCGAVGAFIEAADGAVAWRDFAFEAPGAEPSPILAVGPFLFDSGIYGGLLEQQKVELGRPKNHE
jgi:hypothetical protein